jgi:DNA-binding ferritin-like protein
MSLIRSESLDPGIDALQATVAELDSALAARTTELAQARADLDAFRIRYRQDVGRLHEELDELLDAIAEAELKELAARLKEEGAGAPSSAAAGRSPEPAPRFTSDAVRKLFREVARTIHPDLARDAQTRDRRHSLMIEANRAYATGDLGQLQRIMAAWENSPEAVQGLGPGAARERLARRVAQLQAELAACDEQIRALLETPIGRLKVMVDEASAKGKDLVADMVRRLKRDIMAARNRLDAMRGDG